MRKKFPHFMQSDQKDCGPACLKIIAAHYGKVLSIQKIRQFAETTRDGSNLLMLSVAAEKIGLRTVGVKVALEKLKQAPLPCVLHWKGEHFVVLYKIKGTTFFISDPAFGLDTFEQDAFLDNWIGARPEDAAPGVALLVEPKFDFFADEEPDGKHKKWSMSLLLPYVFRYRSFVLQLCLGLLAGTLLQLCVPFLTQSVVDVGIRNQDMHFIYLVLIAQLFLFTGKTALEFIRSWIVLHLSTRISISLISDFFIKLMNLPISFFDVKITGDIMQRINDHHRIERIMTTSSINTLFSVINMIVMGGVLAYYNLRIFCIFFIGSLLYFAWILIFLKQRKKLDYRRFSEMAREQGKVMELINGMQEIKLHNAERQKRWGWEYIQAHLFKISMKGLVLDQSQAIGSSVINQLKNILVVFFSAKFVIDGDITLGMMMAITSIVGTLDGPIVQLIGFVRELQDARIALSRLSEIHDMEDEVQQEANQTLHFNEKAPIEIKGMSFRYPGATHSVIEELDLVIQPNKITAIVGASGSGKTTLMKLLLKFYEPASGTIAIGQTPLRNIAQVAWRGHVGAVMQEGYIFNETIADNIAMHSETIDRNRLEYAARIAHIEDYVMSLPLGYNTKVGAEGVGMSTGQKQRILIARAVYKNPDMLFFDEATSALDANNERAIMANLSSFFENKTVLIIAHRLSTVMNAHRIVVLDKGKIIEHGNHEELVSNKGAYYELVRNQLELGN